MKKAEARSSRMCCKGFLAFVLAVAMALGCWPTAALQALADEVEVVEEETDSAATVRQDEAVVEEVQPNEGQADDADAATAAIVPQYDGTLPDNYQRAEDCEILPAPWGGGNVDPFYDIYHGNDQVTTYDVTNVTSSDPHIVMVQQGEDGWNYWGNALGTATLTVEYTDKGVAGSYTFDVSVKEEIYTADAYPVKHQHFFVPGQDDVEIYADVRHCWVSDYGTEHAEYHEQQVVDGIEWTAGANNRFSTNESITQHPGDNTRVTVAFRNVANEEERAELMASDEYFTACLKVDGGEVASFTTWFRPCDRVSTILPGVLDDGNYSGVQSNLQVGETRTYDLVTEEYRLVEPDDNHPGYGVVHKTITKADNDLAYSLASVDEELFNCTVDDEAQQFTVKRVGVGDGMFFVRATWTDEEGNAQENRRGYGVFNLRYITRFNDSGTDRLFSDSDLTLTMDMDHFGGLNTNDIRYEFHVGDYVDDEGTFENYEGCFDVANNAQSVTLKGAKLAEAGHDHVKVWAEAYIEDDGERVWLCRSEEDLEFEVCEPQEPDYRTWEWAHDYTRLADDGIWLDASWQGYVNTAAHPDVEFGYRITGLEVVENNPWDEGQEVLELEDRGTGWQINTKNHGDAKLRATYELFEGEGATQTEEFWVRVTEDYYEVSAYADAYKANDWYRVLPGDTVKLVGTGTRQGKSDHFDTYYCKWEVEGNDEWIESLTEDENDPTVAYLKFKSMPSDANEEYRVRAILFVDGTNDEDEVARSEELNIVVQSGYIKLTPLPKQIENLDVGKSVTVTPEATFITQQNRDGERATIINPEWGRYVDDQGTWERWDENVLDIVDNGDGSFTITRIGPGDTNVCLRCDWEAGEHAQGYKDCWYHFDEKNSDIRFAGDEGSFDGGGTFWVHSDWQTEVRVDTSELGDLANSLYLTVGYHDGDDTWTSEGIPADFYTMGSDGKSVIIDGAAIARYNAAHPDDGFGGVNVRAELRVNDHVISQNECWVELLDACHHDAHAWWKLTWTPATCEAGGLEHWLCFRCGEYRQVASDPLGHSLTKVAAKAATLTAAGNSEYYHCTRCGKLFADAAATKQIVQADTVKPKLVNIGGATITGLSNKVYNGKSQQLAPTVKLGATTLRLGTDYSVAYSKDTTNVGTVTVTVTGRGAYGGTKTGTYAITKAASTMTVKAISKNVKLASVKKKAQKVSGAITVQKANGTVSYALDASTTKAKKTQKFKISSKGAITVPKSTAKGVYKLKVNVTCAGDNNHSGTTKQVTVKVSVK